MLSDGRKLIKDGLIIRKARREVISGDMFTAEALKTFLLG